MPKKAVCIGEMKGGRTRVAGACVKCGRPGELKFGLCPRCNQQESHVGKLRADVLAMRKEGAFVRCCQNCELRKHCPAKPRSNSGAKYRREKRNRGFCSKWSAVFDEETT